MIKGRVAFYARSFRFRACSALFGDVPGIARSRAINRGTRPVISTRLRRGSPRGIPKNRKGRLPGHVAFYPLRFRDRIAPRCFHRASREESSRGFRCGQAYRFARYRRRFKHSSHDLSDPCSSLFIFDLYYANGE